MAISRAANDSKLLLRDDFWAPDSMLPGTPFLRRRHYFDFPECVRASSAPWLWTDNCSAWVCWQYIRETILLRPFHFSFPARESRREKNSRADRRERHVRLPQPPLAGDPAGCASYNDRLYRKSDPRTWDAARALSGIQLPPAELRDRTVRLQSSSAPANTARQHRGEKTQFRDSAVQSLLHNRQQQKQLSRRPQVTRSRRDADTEMRSCKSKAAREYFYWPS